MSGEWQMQRMNGGAGGNNRRNANSTTGGALAARGEAAETATEERDQEEYFYVHGPTEEEEGEEEEEGHFEEYDGRGGAKADHFGTVGGRRSDHPHHLHHHHFGRADHFDTRASDGTDPRRLRRHRTESRASDSASIHFLIDDRDESKGEGATQLLARDRAEVHLRKPLFRHNPPLPMGEVDYSSNDFRQARAAIEDAATRQQSEGSGGRGSAGSGRRVRHFGDTTLVTEHRDPYSFYWQLDKLKRAEQEQPRAMPPADYVWEDEEEEAEEEAENPPDEDDAFPEDYLSPDSGVHLMDREPFTERHYARPTKEWAAEDPSHFSHYWQVESGPRLEETPPAELRRKAPELPAAAEEIPNGRPTPPKQISVSDAAQQTVPLADEPLIEEHAFRQTTTRRRVEMAEEEEERQETNSRNDAVANGCSEEEEAQSPRQFFVLPLGQMELEEAQLGDVAQSEEALNRAMAQLRTTPVTDGEDALLEVDDRELRLLETKTDGRDGATLQRQQQRVLRREPLEHIRVWGTDEQGTFAYVSHQRTDGRLLCRVFRCRGDSSQAKNVADALQNACQRALLRQNPRDRPSSLLSSPSSPHRRRRRTRESLLTTPIEEPKRVIRCHFIGVTQVPRATGIETLNEAVDKLLMEVDRDGWTQVDVHISPSMISVFESGGGRRKIASCRVRYLSFLGIGRDVKHCAFIVAQSSDHFVCYVFHADPSAGSLAKTIEAACKLRYQKVMDAHLPAESGE